REYDRICGSTRKGGPGSPLSCPNQFALTTLAKRIAQDRPLDEKPYRGDYDRVGRTTRNAYGTFLSGEGPIVDDVKLSALFSFDAYNRSQDTDTDFSSNRLFELLNRDDARQMYHQLQLDGELGFEPIQWNLGAYYLKEDLNND